MSRTPLTLTREQVLAFRRHTQGLDSRLPWTTDSLRRAAWAGLQDSMPRAALLSLHARVADTPSTALADPCLVQVWGPRFNVFVVAARDAALFTLGRHPESARGRRRAEDLAAAMAEVIGKGELPDREVGRALGVGNAIRYATTTGTLLIRWEGARAPTVRVVPRPAVEPSAARIELARRYLHVHGPTDPRAFARWAGVGAGEARSAFAALEPELLPVRTPIGDRLLLACDEAALRSHRDRPDGVRLLPSGDAFFLMHGVDRELLVPDPGRRASLWTSRVWPGALLIGGQIAGTWRRAETVVDIEPWRRLTAAEKASVAAEAAALPLPALTRPITVRWAR
ncbi:MAG: winged helix DNA-binding domain-containing protein [Kineosporiaceae bacterium]|nr:winged helix DNA-binding domain-containing protein [Kineosporiaceae bacterium]